MGLTALERETVITFSDAEPRATVHTSQRTTITKLKKNPAAHLLNEGVFEGTPFASFEIAKEFVTFRSRRRSFEPEERARRAARLASTRDGRVTSRNDDSGQRTAATTPRTT